MHATLVTSNFGRHGFIQHLAKFNSNIPYNIVPYSKVPYTHLKKKIDGFGTFLKSPLQ